MLQRIYGVAFHDKEKLKAHLHMLEEAAKRDHRKLGREMDLFHMQEEAPGQSSGTRTAGRSTPTCRTTCAASSARRLCRGEHTASRGPQLWEASGHWDKYQEHMFIVEVDEEHAREKAVNALKPMNCPCHVQIFQPGHEILPRPALAHGRIRFVQPL